MYTVHSMYLGEADGRWTVGSGSDKTRNPKARDMLGSVREHLRGSTPGADSTQHTASGWPACLEGRLADVIRNRRDDLFFVDSQTAAVPVPRSVCTYVHSTYHDTYIAHSTAGKSCEQAMR